MQLPSIERQLAKLVQAKSSRRSTEPSSASSFAAGTFVAAAPSAATSSAPMKLSCQVDQAGQSIDL